MKIVSVVLGGTLCFGLLFIAANAVTGIISRSLGLSRSLDDALFIGGILLAALGTVVFVRTIWRGKRQDS